MVEGKEPIVIETVNPNGTANFRHETPVFTREAPTLSPGMQIAAGSFLDFTNGRITVCPAEDMSRFVKREM